MYFAFHFLIHLVHDDKIFKTVFRRLLEENIFMDFLVPEDKIFYAALLQLFFSVLQDKSEDTDESDWVVIFLSFPMF